jgi:inosine-uridine nucleoside N-ribohydrolase
MMHKSYFGISAFFSAISLFAGAGNDLPRIILDTDFRSDCDDAGALAMLHAMADNGECELLGVMASTTGPDIVAAIGAINAHYGRPALPVGLYDGHDETGPDDYCPVLADPERYNSKVTNATAPSSTSLYRRLLRDAPDNSVTLVVIGGQSCIHGLLRSGADAGDDRTGSELVWAKVRELVLMGGRFENSDQGGDWNVNLDVKAAQSVARDWPTQIVYSGAEIGTPIMTGARLADPDANPVAMAYKLHRGTEGGKGVIGNRPSWDQTAVYYAVRGVQFRGRTVWHRTGPVRVDFSDQGVTLFAPVSQGNRFYLEQVMGVDETARIIEDLMTQSPKESVAPGAS